MYIRYSTRCQDSRSSELGGAVRLESHHITIWYCTVSWDTIRFMYIILVYLLLGNITGQIPAKNHLNLARMSVIVDSLSSGLSLKLLLMSYFSILFISWEQQEHLWLTWLYYWLQLWLVCLRCTLSCKQKGSSITTELWSLHEHPWLDITGPRYWRAFRSWNKNVILLHWNCTKPISVT